MFLQCCCLCYVAVVNIATAEPGWQYCDFALVCACVDSVGIDFAVDVIVKVDFSAV